jgi:hypothetical protein
MTARFRDQPAEAVAPQSRAKPDDPAHAAARLRTSAAHARWEEIALGDVGPVIELTKELIGAHLG